MTDFDFALGEHADMIRESTARFAADHIAPLAAEIDAKDWFPRDLWPAMGALGLHGITVDEADGGAGACRGRGGRSGAGQAGGRGGRARTSVALAPTQYLPPHPCPHRSPLNPHPRQAWRTG